MVIEKSKEGIAKVLLHVFCMSSYSVTFPVADIASDCAVLNITLCHLARETETNYPRTEILAS